MRARVQGTHKTDLDEAEDDEPRADLGEVHEHRREPYSEPVSLSPRVFVRRLDRLPLPLVRPREQAAVLLPTRLHPGEQVAHAVADTVAAAVVVVVVVVAVGIFWCEVDEGVVRAYSYDDGAPYHRQHQDRIEYLEREARQGEAKTEKEN